MFELCVLVVFTQDREGFLYFVMIRYSTNLQQCDKLPRLYAG